ncbi:ABC transporter ATP-binding protein [Staphylococcus xylosus]|uniref:ABC transporter ATP-binding protein n=2 Tax=Staphylococcus TaxID=1279 RepID=A0A5R9B191_STAXY|nr:ABC transporter ATP-binding protein [Staphylococcus xylosus]MEB6299536.1 ABC transporter ATP-binding protein [Staphylococcus xylosus]MEB7757449.1 ABC transporter ATP-binding protein [Staphylococcus xylosus]PTI16487.1 antibiotic ABC transporter ATP-binding protein [Staphylococcus xylosus]PTI65242.1 antibiotic ABC transporter ATP-binding protein [Staphylococcus xylosus]RIM85033.1 ABC transporter ATP-binding protein [Staphylococcus xylosus]
MELKNITKTYGSNNVLDHIDFDFGQSQIVGLIGKNGVGKTTLMKVMNGNIINYKGDVKTGNKENIGYLIEHPKLYDNKSGLYNLKLFANVLGKGFDKKYADQIIDAFGMRPYVKKKVKKYSMGMKQKLAIAVSLMNKPKYLILDEPTNGMDPDGSIDVLKTIQSLVKELEMKILISSHKLEDIELICDRAVFLRDGKFVQDVDMKEGTPSDSTVLMFEENDFDTAATFLNEEFDVIQTQQANGEIIIKAQNSYKNVLKGLANKDIYPKFIETRKSSLRDTYFNINQKGGQ